MLHASSNATSASSLIMSPPLVPLQDFSCFTNDDNDDDHDEHSSCVPSYAYALSHSGFALLPSLPLGNNARPLTPPASPSKSRGNNIKAILRQQEERQSEQSRKRRASLSWDIACSHESSGVSDKVRRLKKSPAFQHLNIFTRAAFAEQEESVCDMMDINKNMDSVHMEIDAGANAASIIEGARTSVDLTDEPSVALLHHPATESFATRRVDLTLLVSSLPSFCPYPPTPRSTVLPPLSLSSAIYQATSSTSASTMLEFHRQIKQDVSDRLGLGCIGLGIGDMCLFSSTTTRKSIERDPVGGLEHLTLVIHTAQDPSL